MSRPSVDFASYSNHMLSSVSNQQEPNRQLERPDEGILDRLFETFQEWNVELDRFGAYSSDREQRFHAMVNGAWGGQLESEFLR